jgi:hypothetical protein
MAGQAASETADQTEAVGWGGESGSLSLRVGVTMLHARVNLRGHMAVTTWSRRERRGGGMAAPDAHTALLISSRYKASKRHLIVW